MSVSADRSGTIDEGNGDAGISVKGGLADGRFVLIGAGVVGVCALLSAGSGGPSSAAVLMLAAVIAALGVWGGKVLGAARSISVVLAVSAVVGALALLDLVAVLTDFDDLATYGGLSGLIARVGCAAGSALMLTGAVRLWSQDRAEGDRVAVEGSERLAAIGGLLVVVAWVGMVTSGWFMTVDQAFGIAAATTAVIAVLLGAHASMPLSVTWRHVLMVSLAVVTGGMALRSLISTVGDWGFLIEFGGLRVFGPYLIYLGGATLLGVAGVMEAKALSRLKGDLKLDHIATLTLVVLVTLAMSVTAIGDSGRRPPASDATATTLGTPVTGGSAVGDTAALGPEVPPIDGCDLLTDEAVELALGIDQTGQRGLIRFSGGEGCTWTPTVDGSPADDLYVAVSPGDPDDLQEGAERNGVEGVSVADLGSLAAWFGSGEGGVLSVIADTDIGYALVEVEVVRPDVEDPVRREAAEMMAAGAIAHLRGESPQIVEATLCELVTDAEAEQLLAPHRVGRAAARDEVIVIGPSVPVDLTQPGDTSCKKIILTEIYVGVASGDPADFEPGAQFEGVVAEPVDGVGDGAVWFGGVPTQDSFSAPHEAGILSVRQGEAHFRILLSLPDMSIEDQQEAAKRLASNALIRILAGDATVITIDHDTPDAPGAVDLVGNLFVREEAGEWTRGEGLVQTLQMILGEVDPEEVLPQGALLRDEATGIVNMARLHLEKASDPEVAAELRRLLGMLFFDDTQLEEMAGLGSPTASLDGFWMAEATAATSEDCTAFFSGWEIPIGIAQCLEKRTSFTLEEFFPGEYKVFGPAPPLPTAGWQDRHYDLAIEAMEEVVFHYKALGELPPVNIVFSVSQTVDVGAVAAPHLASAPESQNRPCGVTLFRNLQSDTDLDFKQFVAHELAHCLHGDTFPAQYTPPDLADWWDEGLADYLSNTVSEDYANNNLEWGMLPKFESAELGTGVLDRSYDNFIFFQELSRAYGNEGIFDIISSLPAGGGRDAQEAALGGYSGMPDNYHEFAEKVTDIKVVDTGGEIIPNVPDSDAITLDGPTLILADPLPFGVDRLALAVPSGKFACMEHDQSGPVRTSWRPGRPGVPSGAWSEDMPDVLTGEAVVVATATGPDGEMSIYVEDVSDEPDCEEESEGPESDCLEICDPSDYYRFWDSLPEWAKRLLPPPQ